MGEDEVDRRLRADGRSWATATRDEPSLDAALARLRRGAHHGSGRWRTRTAILATAAAVAAVIAAVTVTTLANSGAPATRPGELPTCGTPPVSSGRYADAIAMTLTAPASAVAGATIHPFVHLRARTDHPVAVADAGLPILSVIVYNGQVVGRYSGAIGGTGWGARVGHRPIRVPTAPLLLSGCPHGSVDPRHPDANRDPLPPGRYQLVATLESDREGEWSLTTPPVPITVTTP